MMGLDQGALGGSTGFPRNSHAADQSRHVRESVSWGALTDQAGRWLRREQRVSMADASMEGRSSAARPGTAI